MQTITATSANTSATTRSIAVYIYGIRIVTFLEIRAYVEYIKTFSQTLNKEPVKQQPVEPPEQCSIL